MNWKEEEFQSKFQKIQDEEEEEEEIVDVEEIAEEVEIMVASRVVVENEGEIKQALEGLEVNETVEEEPMEKKMEIVMIVQEEILGIQVLKEEVEEKVNAQIILELEVEGETEINY